MAVLRRFDPVVTLEAGFPGGPGPNLNFTLGDPVKGVLDTDMLAADNVWTDISHWTRSVTVDRSSTRMESAVVRYEAGRSDAVLRTDDRGFDPTNLSGPYVAGGVSQVVPMTPVRVRVTLGFTDGILMLQTGLGAPATTALMTTTDVEAAGLQIGDYVTWANSSGVLYDSVPRAVVNTASGFGFTNVYF